MASAPYLKVRPYGTSDAYVDLAPYIAFNGLKWSRNDIDASDAGRDQSGLMHRARIAIKIRFDVTCRPLTQAEAKIVLTAIKPRWLEVQYFEIQDGIQKTKKMYSNNIPAEFLIRMGTENYWGGISFPLIEE